MAALLVFLFILFVITRGEGSDDCNKQREHRCCFNESVVRFH